MAEVGQIERGQRYVRDKRNGLIHGYNDAMSKRIGGDLEFCDPPTLDPLLKKYRGRVFHSTQEVREAGFLLEIDIPTLLPLSKAMDYYYARVNFLFSLNKLPEQLALVPKELAPVENKPNPPLTGEVAELLNKDLAPTGDVAKLLDVS